MRVIVRTRYGSHLYGTATPASDFDFKSVYVPDARAILLQRVVGSISSKREKRQGERNVAGEEEEESFSLQRYLALLAEGQTVATDILFAPEDMMMQPPTDEWREIGANRHRLLTRKSTAFVGYCRQQANKYGIKGSRVAAARKALGVLEQAIGARGTTAKLGEIADTIAETVAAAQHMDIVSISQISGASVAHWEVCGRKLSYQASLKTARDVMAAMVADYGHRALQAESQQGVDWKALSHAVRVARQAVELLSTGRIVFPLADAAHILAIKQGRLCYDEVAADIERGLIDVEAAAANSTLRQDPDWRWIDDFVARAYRAEILGSRNLGSD